MGQDGNHLMYFPVSSLNESPLNKKNWFLYIACHVIIHLILEMPYGHYGSDSDWSLHCARLRLQTTLFNMHTVVASLKRTLPMPHYQTAISFNNHREMQGRRNIVVQRLLKMQEKN